MPSLSCPKTAPTLRDCGKTPRLAARVEDPSRRRVGSNRGGTDGEEIRQFITDSFHDSDCCSPLRVHRARPALAAAGRPCVSLDTPEGRCYCRCGAKQEAPICPSAAAGEQSAWGRLVAQFFLRASPSVANGTWGLGNERMGEAHVIVCRATLPADTGSSKRNAGGTRERAGPAHDGGVCVAVLLGMLGVGCRPMRYDPPASPHDGSRRMSWARASDQGVSHDAASTDKHIAWQLVTNVLYRRGALLPRGRRWSGSHRSRCTGWKGGKKTTLLDSSRTRSNRHKMTYRHISVSCPQSSPGRRPRCVA